MSKKRNELPYWVRNVPDEPEGPTGWTAVFVFIAVLLLGVILATMCSGVTS